MILASQTKVSISLLVWNLCMVMILILYVVPRQLLQKNCMACTEVNISMLSFLRTVQVAVRNQLSTLTMLWMLPSIQLFRNSRNRFGKQVFGNTFSETMTLNWISMFGAGHSSGQHLLCGESNKVPWTKTHWSCETQSFSELQFHGRCVIQTRCPLERSEGS